MMNVLVILACVFAAIPAVLFLWNLLQVLPPRRSSIGNSQTTKPLVSVLIPARNEASRIDSALHSVCANQDIPFEVIVLDDHSTDETDKIVERHAARDPRVHLRKGPVLPSGWCGKPHACHVLAGHAQGDWLVFMDADVWLAPDALSRLVAFMQASGCALASGVPRQITVSFTERLLIPLVYFILLGFLPVWRMRRCTKPAYAAGCGQLFIAQTWAYRSVGGHAPVRATLHDGIKLPRLFRQRGHRTDFFDATQIASCRMYRGAHEVIDGLMKNAHEALASPVMIAPMTFFLLIGQVLPWLLLAWPGLSADARWLAGIGVGFTLLPRLLAVWRFHQGWFGALLHPVAVTLYVFLQWWAFIRRLLGHPARWKDRDYSVQSAENPNEVSFEPSRSPQRIRTSCTA